MANKEKIKELCDLKQKYTTELLGIGITLSVGKTKEDMEKIRERIFSAIDISNKMDLVIMQIGRENEDNK